MDEIQAWVNNQLKTMDSCVVPGTRINDGFAQLIAIHTGTWCWYNSLTHTYHFCKARPELGRISKDSSTRMVQEKYN